MPDAFVVDAFIDYLEQREKDFSSATNYAEREENRKRMSTIERIHRFLLASNINTDLSESSIVKFYKKVAANKKYTTLKEHIYFNAVKNQRMKPCADLFEYAFSDQDFSFELFLSKVNHQTAVYFIPCNTLKCKEIENKFGLVVLGIDFDFTDFYENQKIVAKTITREMNGIEECKHPCNSMIIVDPYIFSSTHGNFDKIPGIIKTIQTFKPEYLSIKFHLLILTKTNNNNTDYQNKIKRIQQQLGGPEKVFIEVYAPTSISFDDRIILTNYANINIGHPYDRDTYLNCVINFSDIDENKIRDNYSEYNKRCNMIKKDITKTPDKNGFIINIFKTSQDDKNRLLFF